MTAGPPLGYPGRCASCNRRRVVYSITRSGGGNYRRPNRGYRTTICGECADGYAGHLYEHGTTSRYTTSTLRNIIENRDKSRDGERPRDWGYTP